MGDLQATLELLVEFNKFYNVDLFQRGIYQVRGHLRASPKIPVKVEGSLFVPSPNGKSQQQPAASTTCILAPAAVINGSIISQTFQILYRNEDVHLADMAQFRLHILVDSHKIEETLERLDLSLALELWFGEQGYPASCDSQERYSGSGAGGIVCVSTRTLQLHVSPTKGLHYHLPVLFDYFHLAAVAVTVHASLVAVHQPYIKRSMMHLVQSCAPRSGRSRNSPRPSHPPRYDESSFDSFFFPGGTGVKSTGHAGLRLAQARQVHRDVCSLLSASADALRSVRKRFVRELPEEERARIEASTNPAIKPDDAADASDADAATPTSPALESSPVSAAPSTSAAASGPDCEEEFVAAANSEIGRLCAQNVLLWRQLLDSFAGSEPVRQLLARQHHALRARRFAEAFYIVRHPRKAMANCNDADVHTYLYVTDALRKSRYLASLPPLPVECVEMNGDMTTIPVIFEDRYEPSSIGRPTKPASAPGSQRIKSAHHDNNSSGTGGQQPIYEEIQPQTPCGVKGFVLPHHQQQEQHQQARQQQTLVVNHVYRSLPQTPVMGTAAPPVTTPGRSRPAVHQQQQQQQQQQQRELLLGDPRRRSCCDDKSQQQQQQQLPVDDTPPPQQQQQPPDHEDRSRGSRFKFRPLVSSKSSENFQQLRRVALATAARRNPSLPVKLLGYRQLLEPDTCQQQSNSESLPDLKWSADCAGRAQQQQGKPAVAATGPRGPAAFGHSVSDPSLARRPSSAASRKSAASTSGSARLTAAAAAGQNPAAASIQQPVDRRPAKDDGSTSDCSDQSGWVSSSAASSRPNSPPPPAGINGRRPDNPYPEIEQAPLAPPEEFQDPPRPRGFPARRLMMLPSPIRNQHGRFDDALPPHGTEGAFRRLADVAAAAVAGDADDADDDTDSNGSRKATASSTASSSNKARPLSQEELRLLQLLLYEMCRPGQPNPLIRALSHSLYESLAFSLSLTNSQLNGSSTIGGYHHAGRHESNVSHSTSLPCLIKNGNGHSSASQLHQQSLRNEQHPAAAASDRPLNSHAHRSMSLSTLQQTNSDDKNNEPDGEERLQQKLVSMLGDGTLSFLKAKEDFKRQMHFNGTLYSDAHPLNATRPYFSVPEEMRPFAPEGLHLVVCVHGLDGNSADLRLVKTYLELALPGANLDFLMSERNQGGTFHTFDVMTDRLVTEILCYLEGNNLNPNRISFVGHSLGTIIIRSALTRPQMRPLLPKLHTFLSLSGPHLGTLYNSSGLVNMGLWLMQRWKKSGSLQQLSLKDAEDPRHSFLYRLARHSELHHFRYVILSASAQDRYVPLHSARIEMCRAAVKDPTVLGTIYREMVHNILEPLMNNDRVTVVRYDIHHALPSTANSLIGRAAHIAVLDSELFIEKFLLVVGTKYFQ